MNPTPSRSTATIRQRRHRRAQGTRPAASRAWPGPLPAGSQQALMGLAAWLAAHQALSNRRGDQAASRSR